MAANSVGYVGKTNSALTAAKAAMQYRNFE